MKVLFFIILTLFLVILQSIVLPSFSWFNQSFDLLIIDVLFLSILATRHTMIFAIVGIGCVMDSISGVPFSYHIFSYLWIYMIVSIVRLLLFDQSVVFIIIISFVSVIIQQVLLLFSIFINQGSDYLLTFKFDFLIQQVFWGVMIIPLSIWFLNKIWIQWNFLAKFMQSRFAQNHKGEY